MRKVFDELHHHGKTVYEHAKKHHKKYLWGAAGFFGLFKIFSFIIVSVSGYIAANANILQIDTMTTFDLSGENYVFFLGDQNCDRITETSNTQLKIAACVQGETSENIQYMRFSTTNEEDITTQEWLPFSKNYSIELPRDSEGKIYLYAEYGYDTENFARVRDDINIFKINVGESDISEGKTIPEGESFDISNRYRKVKSLENISKISFNSSSLQSTIAVEGGERNGILLAPTKITDERQASEGEQGLPQNFVPRETMLVGADGVYLHLDNDIQFDIEFEITEPSLQIGEDLAIYYSYDGENWKSLNTSCSITNNTENITDGKKICSFTSADTALFSVGTRTNETALQTQEDTIIQKETTFITQAFRENEPNTDEIINALWGDQERNNPYITNRKNNKCNSLEVTIVHLEEGTNTIPKYLAPKTIYLLKKGTYISDYMIEITGSCSALIGTSPDINLYTSKTQGANIKISEGRNNIIDNLNIYGESDGEGGTHTENNYGIFIGTPDNTLYNIHNYNHLGFGVYMEDFDNTISKVQSYKERIENIYADADTYIDADQKNEENNYGKSDQLAMKSNGTKALIKFDLSRIPQSAKITDAKITLTRIGGNTNTITIQRVLNNARNEGAGNSSPSAFGETNYIYLSYPDSAWFGEKGMLAGVDYSKEYMSEQTQFKKKNTPTVFDLNTYGLASLQEWIDYPELNRGIVTSTESDKTISLGSREYDTKEYRPQITINYLYEEANAQNTPIRLPKTINKEITKELMLENGYTETDGNMVGTKPIDLSLSEGTIPLSITMESVDDKIRVELPKNTKIKKEDGSRYLGTVEGPKNISLAELEGKFVNEEIFKAFKIGSSEEKLLIKDSDGKSKKILVIVPIVDYEVGDKINISYSNDNKTFYYIGTSKVEEKDGEKYIQFTTDHFTEFILSKTLCSFVINNDDLETNTGNVVLNIDCPTAKKMRFGNSKEEVERAEWNNFETTQERRLSNITRLGTHTVYAEFDKKKNENGKTVTTKDEITIIQARPICGNASLEEGEACDDNNTDNQDGCDEKCNREIRGIECNNLPANAVANAAIAIIQGCTVSNGISCQQREPTTSYQYSTSPSTHECFFDCKQGYIYQSGGCILSGVIDTGTISTGALVTIGDIKFGTTPVASGESFVLPYTNIELESHERVIVPGKGERARGKLKIQDNIKEIKVVGGKRDKNLETVSYLSSGETLAAQVGENGLPSTGIFYTSIQVGSTGASLLPIGGNFLIETYTSGGVSGQTINIYRSSDGITRSGNTPNNQCILDANLLCSFETDHLSTFVLVGVTNNFYINTGDPTYTNSVSVSLIDIPSGSPPTTARISNTNNFLSPDFSGVWSSPKAWTLTPAATANSGSQLRTVYVRFYQGTVYSGTSDTIYIDTLAPTGTVSINGGASYASGVIFTLTAPASDANAGMGAGAQMRFSCDGAHYTTAVTYTSSVTVDISSGTNGAGCDTGNGTKTVYAQYKDAVGNRSTSSITDTIIYDGTIPTTTITSPAAGGYYNTDFVVSFSDADVGVGLGNCFYTIYNNGASVESAARTCNSTITVNVPVDCYTNGYNMCSVTSQVRDLAGNLSVSNTRSFSIDTTPPPIPVMNTEPTYTPGANNTVSSSTVTDTGVGNAYYAYDWCMNTTNTTVGCVGPGTSPNTMPNILFSTLANGQIYYYFVRSKDTLGNTSNWSASTFSTQDATLPTISISSPSSGSRQSGNFTVSFADRDNLSFGTCQYKVVNNGTQTVGWTNRSCGIGTNSQTIYTATNCPQQGVNTCVVYGRNIDTAGNTGNESSGSFSIDTAAPPVPTLICQNFTSNVRGTYSAPVYCYINDTATPSARTVVQYSTNSGSTWTDTSSLAIGFTFMPSDGTTYVIMRISDSGGGPTNSNTYIIKKDTTLPMTNIIAPTAGSRQSGNFTVSFADRDNISLSTCQYKVVNSGTQTLAWTNRSCGIGTNSQTIYPGSWCTTQGTDKCVVYGRTIDSASNTSTETSRAFSIDTIAPPAPTLTCTNFTSNVVSSYSGSTTCTINNTATPSPVVSVEYSTNGGSSWTNLGNSTLNFTFTPAIGTTNVIMRISDYGGGPTNSNTYIIIKNIILSCLNGWNNDNFIDDTFWSAYTGITDNIICALYGSGASDTTAYTELWEGRARSSCSPSAMTVMYLTGGTNKIPSHALNNTIYLLASGNYISTGNGYGPYDCSAIIGATGNITLYSTGNITSDISFDGVNMIILDNLRIDGYNNGLGGTHTNNIYGIYSFDSLYTTINNMEIYNHNDDIWGAESYYQIINNSQFYNSIHGLYYVSSANNTIKNSQFYNNTTAGITLETAGFNSISNNQFYNNQYGLEFFGNANNNTINNIQSYNNTEGIYIYDSSSYNTINNSQTYNNTNRGILFEEYAMGNTINNSQSYNNIHGIGIFNYASGSVLNNVEAYNNNYGIYTDATTINRYYGTGRLFRNLSGNILGAGLITGNANQVTGAGWTTGILIQTQTMSRDYITNPINISGNYLLLWTGTWTGIVGKQAAYSGKVTNNYSYGSGIIAQKQPVYYNGTTLTTGLTFNGTKYIGSDKLIKTGNLLGLATITRTTGLSLSGTSISPITKYSLFGDITTYKIGQNINTTTGVFLTNGDSSKEVITQIYDPTTYFATHFQRNIMLDTTLPTSSFDYPATGSWQRGMWQVGISDYDVNGVSHCYFRVYDDGNLAQDISERMCDNETDIDVCLVDGLNTCEVEVFAVDTAGNTGATQSRLFSIDDTAPTPNPMTLVAPSSGARFESTGITLSRTIGSDINVVNYDYRVATDAAFTNIIVNGHTTASFISPTNLSFTKYYRRVQAYDDVGNRGTVSPTWNFTIGSGLTCLDNRQNNSFLNDTFWASYTGNKDHIICALFGTTGSDLTAYTQLRGSGGSTQRWNDCDPLNMNVVNLTGGTDRIPLTMSGNTIYILASGNYISTSTNPPALGKCSALIGSTGTSTIYSTGSKMISLVLSTLGYSILDNIHIDGYNNGLGGNHTNNVIGIWSSYTSRQTMNNIQVYNIGSVGLYLGATDFSSINNSQFHYGGGNGIYIADGKYNVINNSQFYDLHYGVVAETNANYNAINNSQFYNNYEGIQFSEDANYNAINNSQFYNSTFGIRADNGNYNSFNNISIYNNIVGIEFNNGVGDNLCFGSCNIFANTTNVNNYDGTFIQGAEGDGNGISIALGRNDGIVNESGTMSRDYITNPVNSSGTYLLSRSSGFSSLIGIQGFTGASVDSYSYGSGTLTQEKNARYNGSTWNTPGIYDQTKYIGSDLIKKTGDLLGVPTSTSTSGLSLTGTAISPITKYSLFGDIASYKIGQAINTMTGIFLSNGEGTKRIITQIYDNAIYFATHFEKITILNASPPVVGTGYIWSGTTGYNISNFTYYYKGIIIISGAVSDSNGLNTGSCAYTTGSSRAAALYSGTLTTGYCYISGLNPLATINIRFRIQDVANTVTTGATGSYIYDATPPTIPKFTIIGGAGSTTGYTNTTGVTLQLGIACPSDAGIGLHSSEGIGYQNTGASRAWTGCATDKIIPRSLVAGEGIKTVNMVAKDGLFNISSSTGRSIILDTSIPVLGTPFIYSGTTGYANSYNYFYGPLNVGVDAKLKVNDGIGINTGSCKYTTGGNATGVRATAYFTGIATSGYCYMTGLKYQKDLLINFTVKDLAGNIATGTNVLYVYDGTGPLAPITSSPTSGTTVSTGTVNLVWSVSIDTGTSVGAGIGTSGYYYQVSTGSTFSTSIASGTGTTTGATLLGLASNTYYRRVYAFDQFGLTGAWSNLPSFIVQLDATGPTGTISINGGAIYTNNPATTLTLSASDPSGVSGMQFSCNGSTWTPEEIYSTPKSFNITTSSGCTTAQGIRTGYVRYKDSIGNRGGSYNDTIHYDSIAPVTTDNVNSNWTTGDQTITLTRVETGAGITNTYYCVYNLGDSACTPSTVGTSISISCLAGDVCQRYVSYYSTDNATNIETTKTSAIIKIDKQAPQGGYFTVNSGSNFSNSTGVTLNVYCPIDGRLPIQYAYGSSSSPSNRGGCVSGNYLYEIQNIGGPQSIYMRFRDGGYNTTPDVACYVNYGMAHTLYDSGTRYTSEWTQNNCNPDTMATVELTQGTNKIPTNLSGNTVYILRPGKYIQSAGSNFSGCTALVGLGEVVLYGANTMSALFTANAKNNIIISNIKADGIKDGIGGQHTRLGTFITFSGTQNSTINNVQLFNGSNAIMLDNASSRNVIVDVWNYNNLAGISVIRNSNYNIFHNIQLFNNYYENGALLQVVYSSNYNTFNNINLYNADRGGILTTDQYSSIASTGNVYNNISIYNSLRGFGAQGYLDKTIFHNLRIYNNIQGGLYQGSDYHPTNNRYYDTVAIYNNGTALAPLAIFDAAGGPSDPVVAQVGRGSGFAYTTGSTGRSMVTIPINSNNQWLYTGTMFSGYNANWEVTNTVTFAYGTGVPKQERPVKYSGGVLVYTNLPYNTGYYIGQKTATGDYTSGCSISLDAGLPTLGQAYIYSGATGYNTNNSTYYYKGIVDISGAVSDTNGLNSGTCMYTVNGTSRAAAIYSGSASTGYCYKTGINTTTDLIIRFRIQDMAGNINTGTARTYIYDILPPVVLGASGTDRVRAKQGGGTGADEARSIIVDSGGNSYIAGSFEGTGNFGSIQLVSSGVTDAFIAKVSSTGVFLRAKKGGGTDSDTAKGIAVDSEGNTYIAGYFSGTASFGSTTGLVSSGGYDSFIAKISSTGEFIRAKKGGGLVGDQAEEVAVDSGGNSYIAGFFEGTATFGSIILTSDGLGDIFIAKVSSTGEFIRAKKGGGTSNSLSHGIAVDSGGNTYIAGYFQGTGTFGSTTGLVSSGGYDTFIAKVSSTGEFIRAKKGGGTNDDYANGVAIDSGGNTYIAGYFQGTASFGSIQLVDSSIETFIAKLSSTGEYIRAKKSTSISATMGYGLAIDSGGNSYIAGFFGGGASFGGTSLVGIGMFVSKISSTGEFIRAKQGGSTNINVGYSVAVDNGGNSYIAGFFNGTNTFGSTTLVSSGSTDVFIGKISYVTGTGELFMINSGAATTNTVNVTLNITCPTDAGVGGEVIIYDNTTPNINATRTGCTATKPWVLNSVNGVKTVYMKTKDALGNISEEYTDTIILNTVGPTINTGYIYSGATGYNSTKGLYYYKGNPDIKADVFDASNLDTGSCKYTVDGTTRAAALYSGTITTGYCYKTGVVGGTDFSIRFSMLNTAGNTGYGATGIYIYDILPPAVQGGTGVDRVRASKGGGTSTDDPRSIAVDSGGNTYIAGYFSGTASFGSIQLTSSGSNDVFVAKFSQSGVYIRAVKGGGVGDDRMESIVVDSGGNTYMAGSFSTTGTFGSTPSLVSNGGFDTFIAKISSTGEFLRASKGGGILNDEANGVAIDSGGNSYVGGYFSNAIRFGSTPLLRSSGGSDVFIAKVSSTGEYLRAKRGGGTSTDIGVSVAVDSGGNSYIAGFFYGTGMFGSTTPLVSSGGEDVFIAKVSSTGEYLRAKRGGGSDNDRIESIVVDSGGNTYMAGSFSTTGTFGSTPSLVSSGSSDTFITKISSTGEFLRAKKGGGASSDLAYGVAIDSGGNSYMAGFFSTTATFGSTPSLVSSGSSDVFIAKVSSTGEYLRAKRGGDTRSDSAYGIAIDNQGNNYIAGNFVSVTTFGSTPALVASGLTDTFIAKLSQTIGTGSLFTINNNATITNTTSVTLNINCPIDAGVGGEVIIYDNTTPNINATRTGCTATKPWVLNSVNGTKTVYMKTKDALGNISEEYTDTIILDTAGPIVSTGYISSGTTGDDGQGSNYYKGIINISGAVSDSNALNTGTCEYTTGSSRAAALYSGTLTTGYCYMTGLNPLANINIRFRIQDVANTMTIGATGAYTYDATAPAIPVFAINSGALYTNTTGVTLKVNICPEDNVGGIGLFQVGYENTTGGSWSWTGCAQGFGVTIPRNLTSGDGLKTVYMLAKDKLTNISTRSGISITLDSSIPTLGTPVVYSGTTGYVNPYNYFYGTLTVGVDTKMKVDDGVGVDTTSCKYTTGGSATGTWAPAAYTGTPTSGYCYITGLKYQTNLLINFTIKDLAGNIATGTNALYIYDGTSPMIIFTGSTPANNTTGTTNNFTPQLQITETGIGLSQFIYTRNGTPYSVYDSGLVLMYNFDNLSALGETASIVKDASQYANNGTVTTATWTGNGYGRRNGAYSFNGTNDYIAAQTNKLGSSATFVARAKTNVINPNMLWNHPSDASTSYYDLWFSSSTIYLNIGDGGGNPFSGGGINVVQATTGQWHNYITVIDAVANKASLYIDGVYKGQAVYRNPTTTTTGRIFSIAGAASYRWNGSIDEVRVYNRALSTGEIDLLYRSNLNKYATGQRLFTDNRMCMNSGAYSYTGYASDFFPNNYSTGRKYGIAITGYGIGAPLGFDLGSVNVGASTGTLSGQFTGYFRVQDNVGATGWYTTIQLPLALSGSSSPSIFIAQSNIYFYGTGGLTGLYATANNPLVYINSGIYMSGATPDYVNFSGAKNYIKKIYSADPYLCGTGGTYANQPRMKVIIPARQSPGTYSGIITFDINAPSYKD